MKPQSWRMRRELLGTDIPWKRIQTAWDLDEGAARLAWMRGVDDPSELAWRLEPSWQSTFDPYDFDDMGKAVARINKAIAGREKITVYGDYDVDGVTATALMVRVLERLGADVNFFIPNRFNDGYGLHLDCIRELVQTRSPKLLISVDCGVRSIEEVAASNELGMEWVITDHHTPDQELPKAVAVLHPHFGTQSNKHLAGVGVAFKLAQCLLNAVPVPKGNELALLDGLMKLVAIGTIADLVPLTQENALLVRRGLNAISGANSPGLTLLLKAAQCEKNVTASEIAYGVAPRLNAVGRMGGAEDAVKLLLARDVHEAGQLMERVEFLNKERRDCQRELARILPPAKDDEFDLVIDPRAHKGVIGIVASQRMKDCGRPSGVCTVIDGVAHCSLRAPEPYDLSEILTMARPFLKSGGGHRAAAGITFDLSLLNFVKGTFTNAFKSQASISRISAIEVDGKGVDWIPNRQALNKLEPYGQAWPYVSAIVQGHINGVPDCFGEGHWRLKLKEMTQPLTWFFAREKFSDEIPKDGVALNLAVSPQDHIRWGRSWRVDALLDSETTS
ncbi:MAG: DHH family phosphoesterase [Holophagales bacterium]|jgi:single-stranded-DNA-specific exonuclease|nr:DHH family phosphoesterase [Holophagales bacterium]